MTLSLLSLFACNLMNIDSGIGSDKPGDAETDTSETGSSETGEMEELTWGYSGETGPEYWGTLDEDFAACSEGTAQSPIDLSVGENPPAGAAPVVSWGSTSLRAYNPGHYIRYEVDAGSTLSWNAETYQLVQFHFHGLSEHTFNGQHTDIEIHFVHAGQSDPAKLAVVALLLNGTAEGGSSGLLDEGGSLSFREALALPESETPTDLGGSVDLAAAFGDVTASGVLQYTGSLTTPPCTEGVEFFVAGFVTEVPAADVSAFHAVYDFNFRPTQALNARVVSMLLPPVLD